MRRRPKTPSDPKPAAVPEKLSRPFAGPLAERIREEAARAKAEAEARAKAEAEARAAQNAKQAKLAEKARAAAAEKAARKAEATGPVRPATPMGHHGYDDRVAFQQAFADVRPIAGGKGKKTKPAPVRAAVLTRAAEADREARARLESLVTEAVRFQTVREHDGAVAGRRVEVGEKTLDALYEATPKARLDLHGMERGDARTAVMRFVREQQGDKPRDVLVIHGKGLHSDVGAVLGDEVVEALTTTVAAARVLAFVTAPERLGGLGALLVRLSARAG